VGRAVAERDIYNLPGRLENFLSGLREYAVLLTLMLGIRRFRLQREVNREHD